MFRLQQQWGAGQEQGDKASGDYGCSPGKGCQVAEGTEERQGTSKRNSMQAAWAGCFLRRKLRAPQTRALSTLNNTGQSGDISDWKVRPTEVCAPTAAKGPASLCE